MPNHKNGIERRVTLLERAYLEDREHWRKSEALWKKNEDRWQENEERWRKNEDRWQKNEERWQEFKAWMEKHIEQEDQKIQILQRVLVRHDDKIGFLIKAVRRLLEK